MQKSPTAAANRKLGTRLDWAGRGVAIVGAVALLVGAALPWVHFKVFDVDISLPGVSLWGALTGLFGLTVLTGSFRHSRPVFHAILGIAALGIGSASHGALGRTVRQQMLRVNIALAPVNDRLARVALPPVEPFASILRPGDYVGPGVTWTWMGGTAVAMGSFLVFAGERLRRTCSSCGTLWAAGRAGELAFCPVCGVPQGKPRPQCPQCHTEIVPGDKFCTTCGKDLKAH
jgi:hypothetical protein